MAVKKVTRRYEGKAVSRRTVRQREKSMFDEELRHDLEHFAASRDPRTSFVHSMRDAIYLGIDPRRRQEVADAGMIQEDPRAVANLPYEPIHEEYPCYRFYSSPYNTDATERD